MSLLRRAGWLALALSALALPVTAAVGPEAPVAADSHVLRLMAPAAGEVLPAGTTATFAWEPGPGMDLAGAHEWEAFLSLDGGAHWPLRITPHLDLDRRRVSFPVPSVPSEDVRFLLRVGDERREVAYEVPGRFAVRGVAGHLLPAAVTRYRAGEAALAGDEGTVGWVEGAPGGRSRRNVVATLPTRGVSGLEATPPGPPPVGGESETSSPEGHHLASGPRDGTVPALRTPPVRSRPAPPGARAILLMIDRQDE